MTELEISFGSYGFTGTPYDECQYCGIIQEFRGIIKNCNGLFLRCKYCGLDELMIPNYKD